MIEKIGHYSLQNHATIFDEEALTVLELLGRLTGKFNEVIAGCNTNTEKVAAIIQYLGGDTDGHIKTDIVEVITAMIENGAFDDLVSNGRVRPQLFGAVGDGVADDTKAMQLWFSFVAENGLIGYIPNGTYLLNGYLKSEGAPHYQIIGETKTGVVLKMVAENASCFAIYNSENGCTIRNLTIDLNQTTEATHGLGLYMLDTDNVTYEDLIIKNIGYGALLAYHSVTGATFKNLYINRVEMYGVGEKNVDGVRPTGLLIESVENCRISNCYAKDINYYSFEFKNYAYNCSVVNCTAEDCNHGFYLGGNATHPEGRDHYTDTITFANCTAINCSAPFWVGSANNVTLDSCHAQFDDDWTDASNYTVSIRNSTNVRVTGLYWFTLYGLDIRYCENVSGIVDLFRHAISTSTAAVATTGDMVNIHVDVNNTNISSFRTASIHSGATVNTPLVNVDYDKARRVQLLGTNVNNHVIANNVVEAPTLFNAYYSQDESTPYVRETYGSRTGARIEVWYNFGESTIEYRFYDSRGTNTKNLTLSADGLA